MFGSESGEPPGQENPFAPPSSLGPRPTNIPRPFQTPGKVTSFALYGAIAFLVLTVLAEVGRIWLPGPLEDGYNLLLDELLMFFYLFGICGQLVLRLIASVAWSVWSYRIAVNLRAAEFSGLTTSPGWVVGWWFVPFANLFKPFLVHRELFQASTPATEPPSAPFYLVLRWGALVADNVLIKASLRLRDHPGALIIDLTSILLTLVALLLGIALVKRLTRLHLRWIEAQGWSVES